MLLLYIYIAKGKKYLTPFVYINRQVKTRVIHVVSFFIQEKNKIFDSLLGELDSFIAGKSGRALDPQT